MAVAVLNGTKQRASHTACGRPPAERLCPGVGTALSRPAPTHNRRRIRGGHRAEAPAWPSRSSDARAAGGIGVAALGALVVVVGGGQQAPAPTRSATTENLRPEAKLVRVLQEPARVKAPPAPASDIPIASFLDIPERSAKPRERGITHVIDRGLSIAEVEGLMESPVTAWTS